jgi:hypothetical protein
MAKKYNEVFEGKGRLISGEEDTGILYVSGPPPPMPRWNKTKEGKKDWSDWQRWKSTGISLQDMIPEEFHGKDLRYRITVEAELSEE